MGLARIIVNPEAILRSWRSYRSIIRHCERSEAIHRAARERELDCFIAKSSSQ
jgi:hypothetical protein